MPQEYPPESAGGLMVSPVPWARPDETVSELIQNLSEKDWGDVHAVYVLDNNQTLIGYVPVAKILASKKENLIKDLVEKPNLTVPPYMDQEKMVTEAIKANVESVPVVDEEGKFLGVILADKIIEVLHAEHLEDFLRSSGIRGKGSHIIELATSNLLSIVKARLPWLVVGLTAGLGLSIIASRFEGSLKQNIALAFFIPVIAYIADSVGTQTETIFIRAWTVLKINLLSYILKELFIGMIMGSILGVIGGVGAFFISNTFAIGFTVGLSLFIAITIAAVLACLTPITFKALGKDPALGSGPLTTALQDVISLSIYFIVATLVLK